MTTTSLLEHQKDCAPHKQCINCIIMRFARESMQYKYDEFLALLKEKEASDRKVDDSPMRDTSGTQSARKINFDDPIGMNCFSVRTRATLIMAHIVTWRDLAKYTEGELLRLPNFSRRNLNQVKEVLASRGWWLGMTTHKKK